MSTKPHFSLLATSFAGGPRPRNAAIILFGLWLLLFFGALFSPPLLDDADATHANAARAILTSGDWVTLRVDGVRYLEKAPLPYWLAAISFKIFGFNTFAAHLPQALAVLLLMLLGHRWANQAFGARTGYYTALTILTSVGVFLFTRVLIPEALLSLCLGASLFAFLKSLGPIAVQPDNWVPHVSPLQRGIEPPQLSTEPTERPAIAWYAGPLFYPYAMWASLALAVLAKGLVALVFFFATAFLFLWLTDDLKSWRKLRPISGILLFLAIAAPWHILAGIRNPGGANGGLGGHGFWWFYFVNEQFLRFLGKRIPADYNKLPSYLYWSLHVVWLFPWALFLPLGFAAVDRRSAHQTRVLTAAVNLKMTWRGFVLLMMFASALGMILKGSDAIEYGVVFTAAWLLAEVGLRRRMAGLSISPFHRIDPQQRTILVLSIFSAIVLVFFSLSTNQEYYTFPAYLPILLLIAATITRAEQTYSSDPGARRWITFAHATLTVLCAAAAITLFVGLWCSRKLPYLPDIGTALAHRGVGSYTLSMSAFFDLTGPSFAALRTPSLLAGLTFAFGPAIAWMLRVQRRHIAATTAIAFTSAAFLVAAHIAFVRFAPMMSSEAFAEKIQTLESQRKISPDSQIMLFGDQAYGSSIPFYLGRKVYLVNARSSSMLFGSTFPDCPPVFLSGPQLLRGWGTGPRKIVFVPLETRAEFEALMGRNQRIIAELSGKALFTDRPLDSVGTR